MRRNRSLTGVHHRFSFSLHLTVNFILSSFIPFILVTLLLTQFFIRQHTDSVIQSTQSHLDSLARNVNIYLRELQQITLTPYYDENFSYYLSQNNQTMTMPYKERLKIRQSLGNTIDFIRFTRTDLYSVIIVYENNCLFYSTSTAGEGRTPIIDYAYQKQSWYTDAIAADGRVLFLSSNTPDYYEGDTRQVFSLVRSIVNLQTRKPYAVIKVDATGEVFDSFLNHVDFYIPGRVVLLDQERQPVYTNIEDDEDRQQAVSLCAAVDSDSDPRYLHQAVEVAPFGWTLHVLLDRSIIGQRVQGFFWAALALYLTGVLIAMCSYYGISRNMVRSIRNIRRSLDAIKEGRFDTRYVATTNDELAIVGESINDMALKLEQLIEREYVSTLKQKDAEMKALLSQIRPHFLFNTIGGLIALNQTHQTAALEHALFALSSLLRYVVDVQSVVTLRDELTFCQNYFDLQKLRFGPKISYGISADPALEDFKLPGLILQPYFENAVIHGVEPCEHDCTVRVEAYRQSDRVHIVIEDDGVGFEADHSTGVGIENSRQRLKLFYPSSDVIITSAKDKGTRVDVSVLLESQGNGESYENTDR